MKIGVAEKDPGSEGGEDVDAAGPVLVDVDVVVEALHSVVEKRRREAVARPLTRTTGEFHEGCEGKSLAPGAAHSRAFEGRARAAAVESAQHEKSLSKAEGVFT